MSKNKNKNVYEGKGEITAAIAYGDGPDRFSITLEDRKSGTQVVEIELSLEAFARMVAAHSAPCTFKLNVSGNAGKTRQVKSVDVFFPATRAYTTDAWLKQARKILAPLEKDGWKANDEDATNRYSIVRTDPDGKKGRLVRIRFHRFA